MLSPMEWRTCWAVEVAGDSGGAMWLCGLMLGCDKTANKIRLKIQLLLLLSLHVMCKIISAAYTSNFVTLLQEYLFLCKHSKLTKARPGRTDNGNIHFGVSRSVEPRLFSCIANHWSYSRCYSSETHRHLSFHISIHKGYWNDDYYYLYFDCIYIFITILYHLLLCELMNDQTKPWKRKSIDIHINRNILNYRLIIHNIFRQIHLCPLWVLDQTQIQIMRDASRK